MPKAPIKKPDETFIKKIEEAPKVEAPVAEAPGQENLEVKKRGRPLGWKKPQKVPEITQANPVIKSIIKTPFKVWADSQELKEIELTDEEAENISIPIQKLIEYYLPNMNEIQFVWAMFGFQALTIMQARLSLIKKVKKAKLDIEKNNKPEDIKPQ